METAVGRSTGTTHHPSSSSSSSSSNTVRFRSFTTSASSNHPNNGTTTTGSIEDRIVLVRYYLDRPGYDLSNSSSRLWMNPPVSTTPHDILQFLQDEGIMSSGDNEASRNLLVELFLDTYQTFMLLEACHDYNIHFDFSNATSTEPGILNIRLTDLNEAASSSSSSSSEKGGSNGNLMMPPRCNTSPVGLFAFAMTVGLDALNVLRELTEGESSALNASYLIVYSPYAFFVSGLLQFVVGLNEISRNNIYGATAFLAFGCFWLANGTALILTTFFPDQIPDYIGSLSQTATATFVRECYIMLFACGLFKQTLVMNKVTTGLIATLIIYLLAAALSGFHDAFLWMKMVLGFTLSVYALFVFYAELTNEVYHRTVIDLYPWFAHSSEEAFGAAGRANGLRAMAIDLRTAGHHDVLSRGSIVSGPTMMTTGTATKTPTTKVSEHSKYHLRDVRPDKNK